LTKGTLYLKRMIRIRKNAFVMALVGTLSAVMFNALFFIVLSEIGPQPGGWGTIINFPQSTDIPLTLHPLLRVIDSAIPSFSFMWAISLANIFFSREENKEKIKKVFLFLNISLGALFLTLIGMLFVLHLFVLNIGRIGADISWIVTIIVAVLIAICIMVRREKRWDW